MWSYLGVALIFCSGFSSSFGHALIGKWRVLAMASLHWRLKRMATLRWWCPSAVYIWSRSATTTRLPNPRLLSCWPLLCTMWNLVGKLFLATPKEVTFTYYYQMNSRPNASFISRKQICRPLQSCRDFDCSTLKAEKLLKNLFFAWCFNSAARMVMD